MPCKSKRAMKAYLKRWRKLNPQYHTAYGRAYRLPNLKRGPRLASIP